MSLPQQIYPDVTNSFFVQTSTPAGAPIPAPVLYRFRDSRGNIQLQDSVETNREGWVQISLPKSIARSVAQLELQAGDSQQGAIRAELSQAAPRQLTYLTLDKREYAPGETLNFRSVTLSTLGLVADREVTAEFNGTAYDSSRPLAGPQTVRTRRGVAAGSFHLPNDAADGEYRVTAHSPSSDFDDVHAPFVVRASAGLKVGVRIAQSRSLDG